MKKYTVLTFILNIIFCSVRAEFIYSSVATDENPIILEYFSFRQRLDHNNADDDRQWLQRYAVMLTYYKKNGPAFLQLNGARPMDKDYEFPNNVLAYAQNLNAICFSLEHRFYSRLKPENGSIIHHLSTEQALGDISNFIKSMNEEFHLPIDINWIVFGCSYAGVLAAKAKYKFPHLIHGAIVSSAPLIARVDYYEYEQIVEESLKSYNLRCVENIAVAFQEVSNLEINAEKRINISQMFHSLDDNPNYSIGFIKKLILHIMLKIIEDAVQHNDEDHITIALLCKIMTEYNGTKLEALAKIRKFDVDHKKEVKMQSKKNEGQNFERDEDDEINEAWTYQRCSEFGHFSSYTNTTFLSAAKHLLTPIQTEINISCQPFFGSNYGIKNLTEKVDHTNSQYGGLDFNVCNTVFIHGSLDPWYKAGLYKKSNTSLYEVIFINGTSHCTDVQKPTARDIPELTKARLEVFKTLKSWLKKSSV